MNSKIFSILIPAYKGLFLKKAIESVLSQSYKDFELIIVNDASPDDLTSIVSSYIDPRIKYSINEKNCGAKNVVDNWNICLYKATGDYIICMGDDDILLPNCLLTYSDLIDKYPNLDVWHGWSQMINDKDAIVDLQEPRPEYENIFFSIYHHFFKGRRSFIGDYVYRKSHLLENGGFFKTDYAWCADDLTCFRAIANKGIANSQEYVFQYRQNSFTISDNIPIFYMWKTRHEKIEWCKEYLQMMPPPTTSVDKFLQASIITSVDALELHWKLLEIRTDVIKNGFKQFFHWIKKENRKDIPLHSIVNNVLIGLREHFLLSISR